jgi:hypothetical protein
MLIGFDVNSKVYNPYLNQYKNVKIKMKVESRVSLNAEAYSCTSMASTGTVTGNKVSIELFM